MKKILSALLFFVFFVVFSDRIYAKGNFSTFYDVAYQVLDNQTTKVTVKVSLRNDTSDYYASSYSIQTGFRDITNIKASDLVGDLKYTSKKNDKGTVLSFDFNKKVVGINNTQEFSVVFETHEIAQNYGSIWEVNIPGVSDQADYSAFNVRVVVPQNFGSPSFIKPQAKDLRVSQNSLYFSKEDLGQSGISIAYGQAQNYSFNLNYHLQNKNLFPITTELAIPSDSNYQDIKIDDISPRPIDVYIDKDGNWLAKYRLLPSQNKNIVVKGIASVSYKPRREILSKEQKEIYLAPQKYWETDNPQVIKLARELKTPEAIYRYVVDNLKYDSSRVKDVQVRAGAGGALANKKSAVCLEFTDLFIALARAAGIPARAVEGYANTSNTAQRPLSLFKDVLHSWPEYYDQEKNAWIMVDPTWQNTTEGIDYFNVFDFDHLAFVIKGQDSDYPVPAGGYKIPGRESTQDVRVTTSKGFDRQLPVLIASTNFSRTYLAGLPVKGEIILNNDSGVLAPNQTVRITSEKLSPAPQDLYFDKIPPYGKKVLSVKFSARPILTNESDTIKISIGTQTLQKQIAVSPFYKQIYFIIVGGILLGSIAGAISIIIYKRRRIPIS